MYFVDYLFEWSPSQAANQDFLSIIPEINCKAGERESAAKMDHRANASRRCGGPDSQPVVTQKPVVAISGEVKMIATRVQYP
jgi:hypothetical protein